MPTRISCIFLTVLAIQITLLFAFYVLKDGKSCFISRKAIRILNSEKAQRNSTNCGSTLWDMFGWRADTEDVFSNDTFENREIQQNVELVRGYETERSSITRGTTQQQRTTTQAANLPPTTPPENSQPLQQIDKNIWMYSAYFDHVAAQQGTPAVRVFGIVRNDLVQALYCNFSIGNTSFEVKGNVACLPEHHGKKHCTAHLMCNLPANARPTHVSISYQPNSTSTNQFQIIYPRTRSRNFTVCYSILHSGFNSASQLIQSIEMNRILGAGHFMVYNYSISPAVDQILRLYQEDGLVTVLPWLVPTPEVHYYGQMMALNDCFYRNRNISRFVVVVDTDEFIIPRYNLSWMELMDTISPQERDVSVLMHPSVSPKNGLTITGSFEFRSSFFTIDRTPNWTALPSQFQFSEEERNNTLKLQILTLSQIWRSAHIYPAKVRTKYIARPELVYVSGIHFVHSFTTKVSSIVVSSNLALVHHYRSWPFTDSVVDTSFLRFKNQLYPRLMHQRPCQDIGSQRCLESEQQRLFEYNTYLRLWE